MIHIFIETGIPTTKKESGLYTNEWHFINQYIGHLLPNVSNSDFEIIDVGGKDNLKLFKNKMLDNILNEDKNIVIFDCDSPSTGGGYDKRCNDFKMLMSQIDAKFDYFLFPNNFDDGAFEDVLLHIINPKHSGIMNCFENYEKCISFHNTNGENLYVTPNLKAKLYTYITTFKRSNKQDEKVKKGDWDFQNKEYWDLDNSYLNPLKSFLLEIFNKS